VIVIPEQIWTALLDEFARMGDTNERVAFLDGVRVGDKGTVTTLTLPNANLAPGFYEISADAMSQAGTHLRQHRLARLAQVHTHGGLRTTHSSWDDELAYSQMEGAVSIVLPEHARLRPWPRDGTVHLKTDAHWTALRPDQAADLIQVVPSQLDFRRPQWTAFPTDTQLPSTGFLRRLTKRIRSLSS
jgi:hypothetical protein